MKRIQRKRTKGWKMPENTVYVGRPTKWGNPIKLVGDCIYIDVTYRNLECLISSPWSFYNLGDIDDVIYLFEKIVTGTQFWNKDLQYWSDRFKQYDLAELRGKDLACFCSLNRPCHADVLLKYANL